jgi:streptomycin 6-kinase
MHPLNILESEREPWLAIDPKGVTGHPLFDVGTFVCSLPDSEPDLKRGLERRVGQLSEFLGFDRRLIRGWALAQAVLSGWWSYEDHGCGWEGAFARAALLGEIL